MKTLTLLVLAVLLCPFCRASDNMKMVTYFPVPYASYNDVSVTGDMDLGLINSCTLDCANKLEVLKSNTSRPLDTGRFIVRQGILDLNSSKTDSKITGLLFKAGNGNIISKSVFEFKHNLDIEGLPTLQSTQATREAYLTSLKLFPGKITTGNMFPRCEASEISWQKLKVGDTEEAFLICGTGKRVEQTCEENPKQQKCCTSDQQWTGTECKDVSPYKGRWVNVNEIVNCTSSDFATRRQVCSGSISYANWNTAWPEVSPAAAGASSMSPEEMFEESFDRCERQVYCSRGLAEYNSFEGASGPLAQGYPHCSGTLTTVPTCPLGGSLPSCEKEGFMCIKSMGREYNCVRVEKYDCDIDYDSSGWEQGCWTGGFVKTIFLPTAYSGVPAYECVRK